MDFACVGRPASGVDSRLQLERASVNFSSQISQNLFRTGGT